MKKYYLIIPILLISSISFSQSGNFTDTEKTIMKQKIVQKINTPTKVWINGYWTVNDNGERIWKKGYWQFEQKTFQEKSNLLMSKLNAINRV
tara:strand:+ start:91 stop:366 length:276 start_codon:yes stop_codon:yes gene_type:complete